MTMESERRIVAVADVLGFTETVLRQPLEKVISGPITFLGKCLRHSGHQQGWPLDHSPTIAEIRAQNRVGIAWFSDTILVYALSDSNEHTKAVVETCAWLQFETFHGTHTALRIGIDYGAFYADVERSVFVGPALIGAYRLEEAQDWVGGAFTVAAGVRASSADVLDYIEDYNVPFTPVGKMMPALNWISIPHQAEQLRFRPLPQTLANAPDEQTRERIVRKWRNAEIFHEARCEMCRSNRR
jgi:hypothetical protein